MAAVAVQGKSFISCGKWQRGDDCGFSEDTFLKAILVIWILTIVACVGKATLSLRSGPARRCLLLAAASAGFCALDALCRLAFEGYRFGALSLIGSVILAFGLRTFARRWADVVEVLCFFRQDTESVNIKNGDVSEGRPSQLSWPLRAVRCNYDIMAAVHVPFAAIMAVATCTAGSNFANAANWMWMAWCFAGPVITTSLLGLLMWRLVECLLPVQSVASIRRITGINLFCQVLFDVIAFFLFVLHSSPRFQEWGSLQGLVSALSVSLLWLPHAQLLICLSVCKANHAFCSVQAYDDLRALAGKGNSKEAVKGAIPDSTPVACPAIPPRVQDIASAPKLEDADIEAKAPPQETV